MSEEIKINKYNKSISFIHNNIAFSQFGVADEILDLITDLQNELQQKKNIIKEVRKYLKDLKYDTECCKVCDTMSNKVLDILDKGE